MSALRGTYGPILIVSQSYRTRRGFPLTEVAGYVGRSSSLDGNVRRAIDIQEDDKVDEAALKELICAAVALNLSGKSKPKPRRVSGKRAD
ncbi:MAG TPA: hypothetical protein VM554_00585 [Acidisarcina sp.]|nr:hypothetical protein [Acidisarcina sp.]